MPTASLRDCGVPRLLFIISRDPGSGNVGLNHITPNWMPIPGSNSVLCLLDLHGEPRQSSQEKKSLRHQFIKQQVCTVTVATYGVV